MKVKPHQNLQDVSMREFGTIEAVIDLALLNDLSLTEELEAGEELIDLEFESARQDITSFYAKKGIYPATDLTDADFDIGNNEDPCDLCKYFK